MRMTPGKLAAGFLLLAFALDFIALLGKLATLSFVASFICAIWAVATRASRVAGAIVLIIDAAIVAYIVLVIKFWNLP
jgi:hypothetical protein